MPAAALPARFPQFEHPADLVADRSPIYRTDLGAAFHGNSIDVLRALPDASIDLVITSPPYALHFKKEYGNVDKLDYINWILPFATEIKRILKDNGSFILNIGGSYNPGLPTRSIYHFRLLIALCDHIGFHLAQECFWYNPAKLPAPAEWVNVRRSRIKDSVEYVWWLAPTPWPAADNRRVLVPYSGDMVRLLERGYRSKKRPSGHNITPKFSRNRGGAIPTNLIIKGNNESNSDYIKTCAELGVKVHPARFPSDIPKFFLNFLTEPGNLVVDPFSGSNTTGSVAEALGRRWIAVDVEHTYVRASAVRFGIDPHLL